MQLEYKELLTGDKNLRQERLTPLEERIEREKPELLAPLRRVREQMDEKAYHRALDEVETLNRRGDDLLIVARDTRSRTFIERDAIPALKQAFAVKRVRVVG